MLLLPHPGQSEEGVELVVDGLEPHLNLAVVLPVLRASRHDWDTTRTGQNGVTYFVSFY